MITSVNLTELKQLLDLEHADPHHLLGMHEVVINGKQAISVRAYLPHAVKMWVLDAKDNETEYDMEMVHKNGFFELQLFKKKKWFTYLLCAEDRDGNWWRFIDPYSFQPSVGEMDQYLLGEGTHYQIFEKLGAHAIELNGTKGVSFAVWAPNAKSVSVVGDFNLWDGRRHMMRVLGSSGVWEIFIPELSQGGKYKYEIRDRENALHLKSDPYANYCEVRPQTASIIWDINEYCWQDTEWAESRKAVQNSNQPMNIYELHMGSWKMHEDGRHLNYREMADQLIPYVLDMGYTHIELMPVLEHPFDGSWGYQVTGYFAPTSRYGKPQDFMYFVDQCHLHNIGVILDWVPAHFPKDAHGLAKFDGTPLYEHADPKRGEHPHWGTLIFNYGRKEVKNFLIANALFWIEKYHIDGLRVDAVASMLYLDYGKYDGGWIPNQYGGRENTEAIEFLKHMNSILYKMHPGVFMIAEESTAWPKVSSPAEENGLGFQLKWNMGWMNDFLRYMEKEPIHRQYHHNDLTFSMVYAYTERFVLVLSHDEVVHGKGSMIQKMPGDLWQKFANLRLGYGFMMGHPGKKLLFMGSEFGQFAEWSESKELDWFLLEYEHHQKMQDYVKDLNHFYRDEPALWRLDDSPDGFEWIDGGNYKQSILSFVRKTDKPQEFLLFVCNFTPHMYAGYKVGVPMPGTYLEVFNSDDEKYFGSGQVNKKKVLSTAEKAHGQKDCIEILIPPLAVSVWKCIEMKAIPERK